LQYSGDSYDIPYTIIVIILGIETSCDETALAYVQDGTTVLANYISSSMNSFSSTGGVIPELAARKQIELLPRILHQILNEPYMADAIAVTCEPGLQSSLLVGKTTAYVLGSILSLPVIPIHHTLGHIHSIALERSANDIRFPCLTLSLSGGHTELWLRKSQHEHVLLGKTCDDAIGEAFDKGAAILGLSYPGGPAIAKAALGGNPNAVQFPLPLRNKPGYDFSYSGLKTALRQHWQEHSQSISIVDIAASYQDALCNHIIDRLERAINDYPVQQIHLVGGVSANLRLRELLQEKIPVPLLTPTEFCYCTDNAAMIAAAAFALQHR
jgi:N6-L-threonylcarbamoyladenine synthase